MSDDYKRRREWERRFPGLDDEWTHWWIEGDGALLAIVGASDLGAALQIVEKHHEQGMEIFAHVAKLDSFGEVVRGERPGRVIAGSKELPSGKAAELAREGQCCLCGRVFAELKDAISVIQRPGATGESLRCHDECLRARLNP
jgi:hypothetical protein